VIVDCLVDVDDALDALGVAHAFGGTIALAYYADPRGTNDVDVNVATRFDQAGVVLDALAATGFSVEGDPTTLLPAAGIRCTRGRDLVALFFRFDPNHERLLDRALAAAIEVGDQDRQIRILSPNDLAIIKMAFNRGNDWVDLGAMLAAKTSLDLIVIEEELVGLRGPTMHPRIARLRALIAAAGGS